MKNEGESGSIKYPFPICFSSDSESPQGLIHQAFQRRRRTQHLISGKMRANQNALAAEPQVRCVFTSHSEGDKVSEWSKDRYGIGEDMQNGQMYKRSPCLKLMASGCKWPYYFSLSQQRHGNQLNGVETTKRWVMDWTHKKSPFLRNKQKRDSNGQVNPTSSCLKSISQYSTNILV